MNILLRVILKEAQRLMTSDGKLIHAVSNRRMMCQPKNYDDVLTPSWSSKSENTSSKSKSCTFLLSQLLCGQLFMVPENSMELTPTAQKHNSIFVQWMQSFTSLKGCREQDEKYLLCSHSLVYVERSSLLSETSSTRLWGFYIFQYKFYLEIAP